MNSNNKKLESTLLRLSVLLAIFLLLNIFIFLCGHWSVASFGALFIAATYIISKPRIFYHPANVVFANYLIYYIMPYSLWLIYAIFEIEYVLPWGMINDWSLLSYNSIMAYIWMFILMYLGSLLLFDEKRLQYSFVKFEAIKTIKKINAKPWNIFFIINFIAVIIFIELSGGLGSWLNNYSETYLLNRQGLGFLNFYILWTANFSAFALGFARFAMKSKLPKSTIVLGFLAILISIFAQGIKSRIPMLLFFYFASYLAVKNFKLRTGFYLFLLLILMFMFGMYFRSNGFYNTPQLLVEYLQSYFNTIFLHDEVIKDFPPGEMSSIFMGFNKYLEIFYGSIPRENYDLSVMLTQKYFPDQWYIGGGTQQWPVETDLYLSFPNKSLWIIPTFIYLYIFSLIFRFAHKADGFILYVYFAELIRMMSIFRSTFLPWELGLNILSYLFLYFLWKLLFRVERNPRN